MSSASAPAGTNTNRLILVDDVICGEIARASHHTFNCTDGSVRCASFVVIVAPASVNVDVVVVDFEARII
jgi:hypothetical protein